MTEQPTGQPAKRARGRPRDERLDAAILAAAERQLREHGYAGMSLESVARDAATTVPSLRRRYGCKAELAAAVVDSLRIEPLPLPDGPPRERTLAILENFQRNLDRDHSMALLGTLLAEESRTPELLNRFRSRLVSARRAVLTEAIKAGIRTGELPADTDPDVAVNALLGSFYARYIALGRIPRSWPRRALQQIWPAPPHG
jgi:AcrR family transcriptional regulator